MHRAVRNPCRWLIPWLSLLAIPASSNEGPDDISTVDRIMVSADEAWEGDLQDQVHFSGQFRLISSDWNIQADSAVVTGPLDRPEEVTLTGQPARFDIVEDSLTSPVRGAAQRIVYRREDSTVQLIGNAELTQAEQVVNSETIRYELDSGRFSASGMNGVLFRADPDGGDDSTQ